MKRKIFLALTMILTASFLASCSACDSCAGNTKISFKDYYLKDAENPPIALSETLTYAVSVKNNNQYNGYKIEYSNGSYVSTLTKMPNEDFYTLKTDYSINIAFTYNGVTSDTFTDTITSEITFMPAKYTLRPMKSTKTLHTHSPSSGSVEKVEDCYFEYHQTVETTYDEDGKGGKSTITNHKNEDKQTPSTFEIEETDKYTYVDNEQLLFALRCMNNVSGTLQVYSPFVERVQKISVSAGSSKKEDFANLTINGIQQTAEISYLPITVQLDETNSGMSQTAWIAEKTATGNNTYKNVMLKYVVTMPYTLSELHYDLVSMTTSEEHLEKN